MTIIILFLGLILRLVSVNQSLWIDEATSALTTKMSLVNFFGKFMPGDFHPPLYYLTLRIWSGFFGTSEVALRSLSIIFALATIYLVYKLGGKVAALLLATSGLHIYYSQEARMYAMSTFLVTLAIYLFTKILHEKGRVGNWILFSISIGLIGATDYLPLSILPVFWTYALITKQNRKWFNKFVTSHIILAVFALAWSPTFIKQLSSGINVTHNSPSWVQALGQFSIKDSLLIPVKFAIGRVSFDNKLIYTGLICLVFLVFGFLIIESKKHFQNLKLIYLWLLIPILFGLIISFELPILNYFRFLFVLPAFYLIIAAGILNLNKNSQKIFLSIVIGTNLITSFMYLTNIKFQREDWRSAVSFIQNNKSINSAVIFPADSQMEAYHYYAPNALTYGPEAIRTGYSEVWLLRYAQPISDPDDITRLQIESLNYKKVQKLDFNGVVVWKYNKQ